MPRRSTRLGLLKGGFVQVADLLHRQVGLDPYHPQDVHPRHYLVGIGVELARGTASMG